MRLFMSAIMTKASFISFFLSAATPFPVLNCFNKKLTNCFSFAELRNFVQIIGGLGKYYKGDIHIY